MDEAAAREIAMAIYGWSPDPEHTIRMITRGIMRGYQEGVFDGAEKERKTIASLTETGRS